MSRKLALKKLKPSDLSFFKSYLTKHPQTKQKGFNLDSSVVEKQFFPSIKALLEPLDKKAALVSLTLVGPGLAVPELLARKIKLDAKNIRLNGEVVHAADDEPQRYDVLAPDDFAIIEFIGGALPEALKVVLVAAAHPEDASIHAALQLILPDSNDSMSVLSEDEISKVVSDTNPSPEHPIREWLDRVLLEELGNGDAAVVEILNKRRPDRGISPSAFKASKESAERTGRLGEELLDQFLQSAGLPELFTYEWVAQANAISPFDFRLNFVPGGERHADAKSTSGDFLNPVHLSTAEIHHAVNSGIPYDIFRLFNVKDTSATLRVAKDIRPQLISVLSALNVLPAGVRVDSLSFDPSFFDFDTEAHSIESASDTGVEVAE